MKYNSFFEVNIFAIHLPHSDPEISCIISRGRQLLSTPSRLFQNDFLWKAIFRWKTMICTCGGARLKPFFVRYGTDGTDGTEARRTPPRPRRRGGAGRATGKTPEKRRHPFFVGRLLNVQECQIVPRSLADDERCPRVAKLQKPCPGVRHSFRGQARPVTPVRPEDVSVVSVSPSFLDPSTRGQKVPILRFLPDLPFVRLRVSESPFNAGCRVPTDDSFFH
jgi:hypothetical protein